MGLFLCPRCNEQMSELHICDPLIQEAYVRRLQEEAMTAQHRLRLVQDAVFHLLKALPSLEGEKVEVEASWLRKLWDAAQCKWYKAETADSFLARWMALHHVLGMALRLFRRVYPAKAQQLQILRDQLVKACQVLGYNDDGAMDMNVREVLRQIQG